MTECPYCGATAIDAWDEKRHMEASHPEIIKQRLEAIGEHEQAKKFEDKDDSGE